MGKRQRHVLYAICVCAIGVVMPLGGVAAQGAESGWTDFSEYPTGQMPHDWTHHFGNVNWTVEQDPVNAGEHVLRSESGGTPAHDFLTWDEIPETSNVQVLLSLRVHPSSASTNAPGPAVRAGEQDSALYGYDTQIRHQTQEIRVRERDAGTVLRSPEEPYAFAMGETHWMRLNANGDTVRLRVWQDGTPEPLAWSITLQNSLTLLDGTGIWGGEANIVTDIGWFAYSLVGDAPSPADVAEPEDSTLLVLQTSLDPWIPLIIWGVLTLFLFHTGALLPGIMGVVAVVNTLPEDPWLSHAMVVLLMLVTICIHTVATGRFWAAYDHYRHRPRRFNRRERMTPNNRRDTDE